MRSDHRLNRLLSLLDEDTLRTIAPALEQVPLDLEQRLYEEGGPMPHAWFPAVGVLSVLGAGEGARSVEVATIGREGALCVPLMLGAERSCGLVFVQVSGWGWRMDAEAFLAAVARSESLRAVLRRYTQALMVQVMQGTACNRAHDAMQRCARWLLQTHERVGENSFDLKQQFLGDMLGERRATVSRVASQLQERGYIRYTRGRITVLDRDGLEQVSCGCFRIVREEYQRMLGDAALA